MNNIVDYEYVASILDTTVLPRGSASDVFDLLACADSSVTQVCHVNEGSDAVVVDDQAAWDAIIEWLVESQGVAASEQAVTAVISAGCDQHAHNFRAGEVAKILLYFNLYATSSYAVDGYPAADVWRGSVTAQGGVQPAKNSEGVAVLDHAQGYTIPWSRFAEGGDELPSPYGRYGVVTTGQPALAWGVFRGGSNYPGPRGTGIRLVTTAIVTCTYVDHSATSVTTSTQRTLRTEAKSISAGAIYGITYTRGYIKRGETGAILVLEYSVDDATRYYSISAAPGSYSTIEIPLRDDVPLTGVDIAITQIDEVHNNKSWNTEKLSEPMRAYTDLTYVPDVRYDEQVAITYPIELSGLQVTVSGTYTDDATFDVSGDITSPVDVSYRASQGIINVPLAGSITVPTAMALNSRPRVKLSFNDVGHPSVEVAVASGAGAVVSTNTVAVDAGDVAKAAVSNYDRQSIWESFNSLTASDLQAIFSDRRVINDYYLISQMEYTVMQLCSDTIRDMRSFMSSDDGVMASTWKLNFFEDVTVGLAGWPVDPWCRIRLSDEDEYYSLDSIPPESGLVYLNGMLYATENTDVHIERFVYQGRSLDEWYASHNARNEFSDTLAEATIETNTQLLLRSVAMTADQSTNWLGDAGQMLKDLVQSARDEAMDILQLAPYSVITVPQRKAISGSIGAVSIPATYVADMIETAASLGATTCDQVLNLLDQIPAENGDTVTSVRHDPSKELMQSIVRMSPFSGYNMHCTEQRKPVSVDVPYWSTYVQRLGSSIISAGGVESEFTDLGSGACAIFPPLLNGTVNVPGDTMGITSPIILPMEASLVVVYPSHIVGQFTFAWFARYYGGNDYDALSCINDSWKEMARVLNVVGEDFDFVYSAPTYEDVADLNNYDWSLLAGTFASMAMGAVVGAEFGVAGGPIGVIAGAGIGACVAALGASLANMSVDADAQLNMTYRLASISGKAGALLFTNTQETTTDPNVIGQLMASIMAACVKHGAFYPYGNRTGDLIDSNRYAIACSGTPYYRYAFTGEHEDYTPLMITAATALTAISARTTIKAFRHPTRDPAFLPVAVAGGMATAAQYATATAMERAAARRAPTLAMQQDILDAVETVGVAESGIYTDSQGTVTLRDLSTELANMQKKINSIDQSVSNQGTFVTY